jgi:3-mercaptopyruvate sulfurtransferase SseA
VNPRTPSLTIDTLDARVLHGGIDGWKAAGRPLADKSSG